MENSRTRIDYVDKLRIVATFLVILIHVSGVGLYDSEVGSYEWNVCNFYNSLSRCAVPIFVMISGMFFLDNQKIISLTKIIEKSKRLIISFVAWTFFYASVWLIHQCLNDINFIHNKNNIDALVERLILGQYHMWFLYMILGLYVLTPVLRELVNNKRISWYFVILWLIFGSLLPTIGKISCEIDVIPGCYSILKKISENLSLNFVTGNVGYFVLGYLLSKEKQSPTIKKVIVCLGLIGLFLTVAGTYYFSSISNRTVNILYDNYTTSNVFWSVSVFLFFKDVVSNEKEDYKTVHLFRQLSRLTFGVYLIHPFIQPLIGNLFHLDTLSFNPLIASPLVAFAIFLISIVACFIIEKIPYVRKTIV